MTWITDLEWTWGQEVWMIFLEPGTLEEVCYDVDEQYHLFHTSHTYPNTCTLYILFLLRGWTFLISPCTAWYG